MFLLHADAADESISTATHMSYTCRRHAELFFQQHKQFHLLPVPGVYLLASGSEVCGQSEI